MYIEIDDKSGFCFEGQSHHQGGGIARRTRQGLSLGDIVHNRVEVQRLEKLGLETIAHSHFPELDGQTVLIRAHGNRRRPMRWQRPTVSA